MKPAMIILILVLSMSFVNSTNPMNLWLAMNKTNCAIVASTGTLSEELTQNNWKLIFEIRDVNMVQEICALYDLDYIRIKGIIPEEKKWWDKFIAWLTK
jgi:hypothetical protein